MVSRFHPSSRISCCTSWVTIKKVPLYLYYVEALFELAKPIGRPLRVDNYTANLSRLDRVRICIEVDLSKPLLKHICINALNNSLTLNVLYEDIPNYCQLCSRLGHQESKCFVKFPEKKNQSEPDVYEDARDHLNAIRE